MSQASFAAFLGVDPSTVRSWEQGIRLPSPLACRLLSAIAEDPDYWRDVSPRALQRTIKPEPWLERVSMNASDPAHGKSSRGETDVLIVGSGPTGLMAATLLARCGVSVRIVDKTEQQAHESRTFGVQAKSLELFLNIGIADEFLNRGVIAAGAQVFLDGKQVSELNFDDIGRPDTPYSFALMVPQWDTEAILVDDLKHQGIDVEHGVQVIGFTQDEHGVVARATDKACASFEINAAYLIGADGAHSIVRKTLGLTYEGDAYPQGFLLADCKIDWPLDYDHMKLFLRGRHFAVYLPLKGKDVCRVIAIESEPPAAAAPGTREAEATTAEPISLDEVQAALREAFRTRG